MAAGQNGCWTNELVVKIAFGQNSYYDLILFWPDCIMSDAILPAVILSDAITSGHRWKHWVFLTIMKILYQNVQRLINKTDSSQTHFGFTSYGCKKCSFMVWKPKEISNFDMGHPVLAKNCLDLKHCTYVINFLKITLMLHIQNQLRI